jgi:Uncharacterized protein conserved in bacteria
MMTGCRISRDSNRISRRALLRTMSMGGVVSLLPRISNALSVSITDAPDGLAEGAFSFLPLGSIRAKGWLLDVLRIQATGLSGHLSEVWPDVGENSGWLGGTGESWERGPYYLDGLLPLAYLVEDERLKKHAQRFMDWILEHPWPNGMLGPQKNDDWWPRFVMLKALTQYQELTGDARVIPALDRYFKFQLAELPRRPLRDWGKFRWQDELLSVLWLYRRTGSPYLVELAKLLHEQGFDWISNFDDFRFKQKITAEFIKLDKGQGLADLALATHGVNNGQAIKTGPVWSQISHDTGDRTAARRAMEQLDQYHGLPNGMFSCDEHLSGRDPSQGSELCTVVELMYSLEHCLAITGDVYFADRLEKLAFNALPGALTDDMWAHQYNQEPNQVECSLHRKPWVTDGPESNLFGLAPNFGCCTANFHQGWPKFVNSVWMATSSGPAGERDGLVASAYAPTDLSTTIRGIRVRVVEETEYPFKGRVRITVSPEKAVRFPLRLRIPGWANGTSVRINGQATDGIEPGTFALVERTWASGDSVEIEFHMEVRATQWFHNSIAIERGPLVFSYGIGESWVKLKENKLKSADWQVFPTTAWNYALSVDRYRPGDSIKVIEKEITSEPFSAKGSSLSLTARARKVPVWRAEDGVANPVPESPERSDEREEEIQLIPYAAAKLRITAFPRLG